MNPLASRIALIVGHTQKRQGAPGAYPIASSEYRYNTGLAELAAQFARSRAHEVEIFFRDGGGIAAAYDAVAEWEADCAIELHFNAFNGQVAGTETLYCDDQDHKRVHEFEFATLVQQHMCRVFERSGRGDRGLKKRPLSAGERGYFSVNQLFHIPSVLVEPFFGDNREEAKLAVERKQELAEGLVLAVEEWKQQMYSRREMEVSSNAIGFGPSAAKSDENGPVGLHFLPAGTVVELRCDEPPNVAGAELVSRTLKLLNDKTEDIAPMDGRRLAKGKPARYQLTESGEYELHVTLSSSKARAAQALVSAAVILPGHKGTKPVPPSDVLLLAVPFQHHDGGSVWFHSSYFEASVV